MRPTPVGIAIDLFQYGQARQTGAPPRYAPLHEGRADRLEVLTPPEHKGLCLQRLGGALKRSQGGIYVAT